jgi:hypothetical protein
VFKEFHIPTDPRPNRARFALAILLVLAGLSARNLYAQGCNGTQTSVAGPQYQQWTTGVNDMWGGDQWVYGLSLYGFVRANIANPDNPTNTQLAQVGYDRGISGGRGGKIVIDCDCHDGGLAFAAAESPSGDSRLISDWDPYFENPIASTEIQAAEGAGSAFVFGQQVNAGPTNKGRKLAAIYLPGPGKFFGYIPAAAPKNFVQTVDLTTMTQVTGQTCQPPLLNGCVTDTSQALQPSGSTLSWADPALYTGQATVGGTLKYILVGVTGNVIRVAYIDPSTGIPTDTGMSVPYTAGPQGLWIATVKSGAYIFTAEGTAGGLRAYEIQTGALVAVQQPLAFQANISRVVVKASSPSSTSPLIFMARQDSLGNSFIDVYDTNWLTPGSTLAGTPRLGATIPHVGTSIAGTPIAGLAFAAKVVQNGSVVTAYVFRNIRTSPEFSIASTKTDVSCIAADPNAPAAPSYVMTNLSVAARAAAGRPDANNYQGDRWRVQDTSSTGIPLNLLQWQLDAPDLMTSNFAVDFYPNPGYMTSACSPTPCVPQALEVLDQSTPPGTGNGPGIIWPCNPQASGPGDPNSGSNCYASVGSISGTFNVKIKATNANPQGTQVPVAAGSQTVLAPTVYVNGQTGSSADVSVLTGQGVLNALSSPATQGNAADAIFNWAFFGCAGGCSPVTGSPTTVNVPATATSYSLSVTYIGGYTAPTVTGAITQTDIIPSFSLNTSTPLVNGPLTLTNTMQKSSLATVTSVAYTIAQGGVPVSGFNGTLLSTFNSVNGQATVTVPGTVGNYTIQLIYTYSLNGVPQGSSPIQPVKSFSTITWAPAPSVGVYYDAAGVNPVSCPFGCNLVINTTYYLKDAETIPNGITHPGAQFFYNPGSGEIAPPGCPSPCQTAPGTPQPTVAFTPNALCATGCYVKVLVSGQSAQRSVTVNSSATPLSASVNGPTNGSVGSAITFTANVVGGTPPYSYQWTCSYGGSFTNWSPGGASFPCTYTSSGTYPVVVKVTDAQSNTVQSASYSVIIGGGGGGALALTVSGPATGLVGTAVTFTASASGGSGGYTFTWTPGESIFDLPQSTGANPAYTHTYPVSSTYTVTCTVTSGGSSAQGHATIQILGSAAPSAGYTVQGATANGQTGNWDVGEFSTVTLTATENQVNVASNGFVWDFGDGSPQNGKTVQYSYSSTGLKNVRLTVTGDGVNRVGTATATVPFNVIPPSFQALIVPAAEHQPVPNTGGLQYSRTDVTVGNPGTQPVNISPAYLDFLATTQNCGDPPAPRPCWSFDLSTIQFDPSKTVTIPPKGSWTQADVVQYLAGDIPTKGILVLKFDGGDATPLVTARVYSAPTSDPTGPSAGTTLTVVPATKDGQVVPQGEQIFVEQDLAGLRSDSEYYFRLSLVNSAGLAGSFHITAWDQVGNPVTMKDPRAGGAPAGALDFAIGPYQGVDWSGDDLGLNDPSKRYIVKATRTQGFSTGELLAFVKLNDRQTGDPTLITPDTPPAVTDPCSGGQSCVNYIVPGARRYLTPQGAHWKTTLTVYNPSGQTRGVGLTYLYSPTSLLPPEKTASQFLIVGPGQLAQVPGLPGTVCCDDAIAQLFATPANGLDNFATDSAGLIILQHFEDNETSTAPLIILSRTYDDEPTGTVGSQLEVFTRKMPLAVGPADGPLVLTGLQTDTPANAHPRFQSTVNVFAYEDMLTVVKLTALKSDGTVLGTHFVALNNPGASGHFQPRFLDASDITGSLNGAQDAPVSIKIEVVQGGHVGAFGLVEDIATHDPTFVQSAPQN